MKPSLLLTISAIYLVLVGLGMLLVPQALIFSGSAGTPAGVWWALRHYGGVMLGIAVLNWMARNAEASKARDAIFLGITVAYTLTAIVFVLDVVSGGVVSVWAFAIISALFAVAFFVVGRANMSTGAG